MLVSSSALLTHGVKLATASQWDHVAMIVNEPGKPKALRLFEATMEVGVCEKERGESWTDCANLREWTVMI